MNRKNVSKAGNTRVAAYESHGGTLATMQQLHATIAMSLGRADLVCSEQDGKCIEGCPFGRADQCSLMKGIELYPEVKYEEGNKTTDP